jgi:hypothetical protein
MAQGWVMGVGWVGDGGAVFLLRWWFLSRWITRNRTDTIKHEENSIEGGVKKLKVEDEMREKIVFCIIDTMCQLQ